MKAGLFKMGLRLNTLEAFIVWIDFEPSWLPNSKGNKHSSSLPRYFSGGVLPMFFGKAK